MRNEFSLVETAFFESFLMEWDGDDFNAIGRFGEVGLEGLEQELAELIRDVFGVALVFECVDGIFEDRVGGIMGCDEKPIELS